MKTYALLFIFILSSRTPIYSMELDDNADQHNFCSLHKTIEDMPDDYSIMTDLLNNYSHTPLELFHVNSQRKTALNFALYQNKKKIARAIIDFLHKHKLINHHVINDPIIFNTPLIDVIVYDDKKLFDDLLDNKNADVLLRGEYGCSPLYYAALYCKKDTYIFEKILKKNSDLFYERAPVSKATVLSAAVKANNIPTVKFILNYLKTLAGSKHKARVASSELKNDGSLFMIDSVSNDCKTPLHIAAENGFHEIVHLLLANGADRTLCDKQGKLPRTMAEDMKTKLILYNYQRQTQQETFSS